MLKYKCKFFGLTLTALSFLLFNVQPKQVWADKPEEKAAEISEIKKTGLPLPRFLSLKANRVNMRKGPGMQHPISWKYERKWLPIEVKDEYDDWRLIKDIDGNEGWVHKSMLSSHRTALINGKDALLMKKGFFNDYPVMVAQKYSIVHIDNCDFNKCYITANKTRGWVQKAELWGVYLEETIKD